jgi:prepilin-type N-terminal cleavage/methylation domain-containing protein
VRNGFTLIEVLVALVLFEFGMLALAASSAVAARDLAAANLSARAQTLARNRVELLRGAGCPAPGGGDAHVPRGMREFWRVAASGQLRIISDSVEFMLPRARPAHVVSRAWAVCAPASAAPVQ